MALKIFEESKFRKFDDMPTFLYKSRFIIAIVCAAIILLSGCKKSIKDLVSESTLRGYFDANILNKTFIVDLATDSSNNITNLFSGYNFVLTRDTSFIMGPMTATKDGITYTGRWISNDDYGKLDISITSPITPANFNFLNRNWRFIKKDLPVMQLSPYGTLDPKVLHMRRL